MLLGISEAVLHVGQQTGVWMQGTAALASLVAAAAGLTLDLRCRLAGLGRSRRPSEQGAMRPVRR